MKKILVWFVLLSLLFSFAGTAKEVSLAFLSREWTQEQAYPEWYAGRYLDEKGNLIYGVTKEHAALLPEGFLQDHFCDLKQYSYNDLMRTLHEITEDWMSVQPAEETVCLQSAALDEVNNCISVELYSGSDRAAETEQRLLARFGDKIRVSVTDELYRLLTEDISGKRASLKTWGWLFLLLPLSLLLLRPRRASPCPAGAAAPGGAMGYAQTAALVKKGISVPGDSVFLGILKKIEEQERRG